MGLKAGGLRGSLRSVSTGVSEIPDGAIHQWKYDEGSGTTAADAIGSLDGSINGASWLSNTNRVGGHWLSFDGTDDSVSMGDVGRLANPIEKFAVAVTIDIADPSTNQAIWQHVDPSTDFRTTLSVWNGALTRRVFNSTDGDLVTAEGESALSSGLHRIGFTFDGATTAKTFLNGNVVTDSTDVPGVDTTSGHRVGASASGSTNFAGQIDNVLLYNDFLSDSEITDDYNAQPWS